MDLNGEEPIQEDDEDKMGWQESTEDPGILGGVDGAVSWEFYLHLLTHFKPTLNPFCILLPGIPERDCKVLEAQRGAKVIMNKVLIKLVVPKKTLVKDGTNPSEGISALQRARLCETCNGSTRRALPRIESEKRCLNCQSRGIRSHRHSVPSPVPRDLQGILGMINHGDKFIPNRER